ncbi:MAG: hypothetical protein C0508_19380, partial [Cyanobacteria bacterium PR.023]|nr:hypothetical protein [Cyanobacteria bacterium PR.023]
SKYMSALIDCLVIVGGTTVLSLVGVLIVRKRASRQVLEASHEVGGYLLAIIGTLYAILVGLIVVNAENKVDTASDKAVVEANRLTNIYHVSHGFEPSARHRICESLYNYATTAVNQDWEKVESGVEKEGTVGPYRQLWKDVVGYSPRNDNERECYAVLLEDLEELSDARKYRMVAAKSQLSPILWAVLIAGGIMIVLFTYFFFVENLLSQLLMTASVVIFLSMNVYLIYVCQNPYRPELGAKEAGFGFSFNPNWFKDEPAEETTKTELKQEPAK